MCDLQTAAISRTGEKRPNMTKEQIFAVYEAFLKQNPHVSDSKEMAQRIVDRYNASQPLDFTVRSLTEIAGHLISEDNQLAATQFVANLNADTYELTLSANPTLREALEGKLTAQLDVAKIKIVEAEPIERGAGAYLDRARIKNADRHHAIRERNLFPAERLKK